MAPRQLGVRRDALTAGREQSPPMHFILTMMNDTYNVPMQCVDKRATGPMDLRYRRVLRVQVEVVSSSRNIRERATDVQESPLKMNRTVKEIVE